MRKSLFLVLILAGCSNESVEPKTESNPAPVVVERQPSATPVAAPALKRFREVIVEDVPEGEHLPPLKTVNGLSVGKLYEQVAESFDQIKFVDQRGRPVKYFATLKTEFGDIRIELLGDAAPNHVRNFIALARAGYYNGMPFHQSVRRPAPTAEAYIETGCPLGTGDLGYGSIGYWLRPEPSDELIHDVGVVGTSHSLVNRGGKLEDLDNAACKFYVALSKAAWRDQSFTIFGKVVQGIDFAHTISQRPNRTEKGFDDRPERPVVIREVTIEEVVSSGAQIAAVTP